VNHERQAMSDKHIGLNKHFDKLANLVLYGGFILGLAGVYFSRFDSRRQFVVILLMVTFYLVWGFVFHHLRRDAARWLMFEYLLIGLIALLSSILVFLI